MLYSLRLSFLYQRDKETVLLWIAGIIPLESLYNISEYPLISMQFYPSHINLNAKPVKPFFSTMFLKSSET